MAIAVVLGISAYMAFHALSYGPVTWLVVSEIFPNAIRLCLEGDDAPDITFASFQHRDEALQLLTRCLGALEPPSC